MSAVVTTMEVDTVVATMITTEAATVAATMTIMEVDTVLGMKTTVMAIMDMTTADTLTRVMET